MKTLTIPPDLMKEKELVVIPRRDYEWLLALSEEKVVRDPKIDRELALAMQEVREGKVEGPFDTVDDFMAFLHEKKPRRVKK